MTRNMIDLTTLQLRADLRRLERRAVLLNAAILAGCFFLAMGAAYWWAL